MFSILFHLRGRIVVSILLSILVPFLILSCQNVPKPSDDYALARAALEAAKAVQAPRHSPGHWHQAENFYRKGQIYYRDQDWEKAKESFLKARLSAEKAENAARLIRQRTGEVL